MFRARITRSVLLCITLAAARSATAEPAGPTEGELRIIGPNGVTRGFCPLKHTDVAADVAGLVSRVTVRQEFHNPTSAKIEAIYVFPLPQNAAVDDMTMTVGSRTIRGRIKERGEARAIYEQAKAGGHVASLLDQERPNIFTQSVANIEPGERVVIEIAYVDLLKYEDGRYEFMFPMVVGPRYIPGQPVPSHETSAAPANGIGWSPDTTKVPDASKITPPVAAKGERTGHDLSLTIKLDTGRDLAEVLCPSHSVDVVRGGRGRATITLKDLATIPNKDFVLQYRTGAEGIGDAMLAHVDARGGFFTLVLEPPARVEAAAVVPRELIFVLDTSGSMMGFPIDKAKQVMARAIDAMRPGDTFNMITFSGDTHVLWASPRPATQANRDEAQRFLASRQGGGGTEMMKAIEAALVQTQRAEVRWLTPAELADLPADGRTVEVRVKPDELEIGAHSGDRSEWGWLKAGRHRLALTPCGLPHPQKGEILQFAGAWETRDGRRILRVATAGPVGDDSAAAPMRIAVFMTDGYVGNDMEIIDAVKKNAATTRVFSLGIGNSVNRFLLDGMARAGRGEVQYVLLQSDASEAVQQLSQRIETPVLTDISLDWGDAPLTDVRPAMIPDLFSVKPVVIHGRYKGAFRGTIRLRGRTGAGPFERTIAVDLPSSGVEHPALASLWARAKAADLMDRDLLGMQRGSPDAAIRKEVLDLGLQFAILTPFTSFVAVEELRVTIGGEAKTIAVPVEMPEGVSHEGVFGETMGRRVMLRAGLGGVFGGGAPVGGVAVQQTAMPASKGEAKSPARLRNLGYLSDEDESKEAPTRERIEHLDRDLKDLCTRYEKQGGKGDLTLGKLVVRDGKVEVMIALKDLSAATLASLKQLGVEILSQTKAVKLVIARVDVRKLEALAKLDTVLRIEPVR